MIGTKVNSSIDNHRPDLAKPASTLYMHNLTGVMETAIRATNAQYENPEILKRLDCRLLEAVQLHHRMTLAELKRFFGVESHAEGYFKTALHYALQKSYNNACAQIYPTWVM
ncbi:predicted protein [Nematostella vectensis]|uniref:Gamma tubulin complex component C-terminal domain-containing protein n=1 Tax=Nematostella vectensis TaxID=45351 RepID=A7SIV1_NEMVE|nr:predicted protein [Nematostella vectensis]|eukprot:XP_001628430.1 predicted protein [Nematostella vectensis]